MTQTHPQKTTTDKEQRNRFRKAARDAGCEDNEERFKQALRTVTKHKVRENGDPKRKAKPGKDGR